MAAAAPPAMSHTEGTEGTMLERVETRLCNDCEGLRFDDEGCGGSMDTSNLKEPALKFREGERGESRDTRKRLMHQNRTDSSPDFPTLAKSAAAGCGLCGYLRAAVLRASIKAMKRQGEASIHLFYTWGPRRFEGSRDGLQALTAKLHDARGQEVGTLQFNVYSRDDATRDWLKLYSPPRRESLCPENVSFLKKVLETCTSDCHPPANTPYLPTRLLDLGTDPASHPRLIITADSLGSEAQNPAEPIRYAALSYCWGSRADATAQTKTEPSNLHERLRAIPTHDMSAVMQDAVKVCRALSVRYLWIDALCIIQDPADPSDWERESERVGKVYQHAYFTICAVSTPSCHYSFLARSQHTFDLDFQSSLYPPARGTYTLVCCTGLAWGEEGYDPLSIDFRHSAWYERGWVFQEDNLSARKLLFGQHMVHFVCGRMEVSENDENCWSAIDDWSAAAVAKLGREELFRQFSNTAGSYGGRMLSYESDRLPALSGLARHVYDATGAKYLAGLWKEDLHRGLLWYGQNDISHSLVQHLDAIRASAGSGPPSWSWVSQPGYFDHGLHSSRDSSDRHSVRPEYGSINGWTVLSGAQLNPFGQVKSGTIRIQGKVSSVPADFVLLSRRVFPRVDIWKVYHDRVVVAYCHLDWDVGSPKQEPGRLEMLLLASSCSAQDVLDFHGGDGDKPESEEEDEEGDGDVSEDGDEHEHEGDPNPASPLEAEINNSARIPADGGILPGSARPLLDPGGLHDNEKSNRNAWGLIIHPAQKPGEYYRVGVFVSPAGKASGTRFFKAAKERSIDII